MSIRQLSRLAVTRNIGSPTTSQPKATGSSGNKEVSPFTTAGALETLTAAIPTEPLAVYTALVGAILAIEVDGHDLSDSYVPLRWWLFAGGCAFVVLSVLFGYNHELGTAPDSDAPKFKRGVHRAAAKEKPTTRKLPVPEILTSLGAFALWGLAMPDSPLHAMLESTSDTITTLIISVGGGALVGMFSSAYLTKPASTAPKEH